MIRIDWDERLDINLPQIDTQHRKLIELANGLLQAMINGMGQDVLADLADELTEYTDYHFRDEEAFMEKIGYPALEEHKEAHRKLTDDVMNFRARILLEEEVSPNVALDFLNGWIVTHIQEADTKFAAFSEKE